MNTPVQPYAKRVAQRVKVAAFAAGISRKQLAEAMGLSEGNTSKRLNGRQEFQLSELERIAPLLGETPEALADPDRT